MLAGQTQQIARPMAQATLFALAPRNDTFLWANMRVPWAVPADVRFGSFALIACTSLPSSPAIRHNCGATARLKGATNGLIEFAGLDRSSLQSSSACAFAASVISTVSARPRWLL